MSVFQTDPTTGELLRDRRGFVRIGGLESIAQDLRIYLRLRRGEIPTRIDLGLPWWQLLEVGVDSNLLARTVGEEGVLTRPGVVDQSTSVEIDGTSRVATVEYRARVDLDDLRRSLAITEQVRVEV